MTTMLKSPRRLRRARRLRDAARYDARIDSDPFKFDTEPPVEPPACLKNRKPDERLTNSECIEALDWLQACIRSIVIKDDSSEIDKVGDDDNFSEVANIDDDDKESK